MRRNRGLRRQKKKEDGAPKWMVTYSDMVTLILVFFILLFAMSQIDNAKFQAITESFRNRVIFEFNPSLIPLEQGGMDRSENEIVKESKKNNDQDKDKSKQLNIENEADLDALNKALKKEDELNRLMNDVQGYLENNNLNDVVSATRSERGVELVLQDSILFDSGEANILASGEPFLNKIGELLKEIPNYVRVEGHTDNRPISSYRFPSNWELSGARAGSVIRYLIHENNLEEQRFSAIGYGDTRPIAPNDTDANYRKNRRVEIVILDSTTSPDKEN